MTPVQQSKLYAKDGIHNGNCYAACLASLLDIPLWMVPPFEDMFVADDYWRIRTGAWLARMFGLKMILTSGHDPAALPEYYIANGMSARGVYHSTIYRAGALAHDPHPSGTGIADVEWTWHLEQHQARDPLTIVDDILEAKESATVEG